MPNDPQIDLTGNNIEITDGVNGDEAKKIADYLNTLNNFQGNIESQLGVTINDFLLHLNSGYEAETQAPNELLDDEKEAYTNIANWINANYQNIDFTGYQHINNLLNPTNSTDILNDLNDINNNGNLELSTLLDENNFPDNIETNINNNDREIEYNLIYDYFLTYDDNSTPQNSIHTNINDRTRSKNEFLNQIYKIIKQQSSINIIKVSFPTNLNNDDYGFPTDTRILQFTYTNSQSEEVTGEFTFGDNTVLTDRYVEFVENLNVNFLSDETNLTACIHRIDEEKDDIGTENTDKYYGALVSKIINLDNVDIFKKFLDNIKGANGEIDPQFLGASTNSKKLQAQQLKIFYNQHSTELTDYQDLITNLQTTVNALPDDLDPAQQNPNRTLTNTDITNPQTQTQIKNDVKTMNGTQFKNERGALFYSLIEMLGGLDSFGAGWLADIFGDSFNDIIKDTYSDYKLNGTQKAIVNQTKNNYNNPNFTSTVDFTEKDTIQGIKYSKNKVMASIIDNKTIVDNIDPRILMFTYKYKPETKKYLVANQKTVSINPNATDADKIKLIFDILEDNIFFGPSIEKTINKINDTVDNTKQITTGGQVAQLMASALMKFPNKDQLHYLYTIEQFNNFDAISNNNNNNNNDINPNNVDTQSDSINNLISELDGADDAKRKAQLDGFLQGAEGSDAQSLFNYFCENIETAGYKDILVNHLIPYLTTISSTDYTYSYNQDSVNTAKNSLTNPIDPNNITTEKDQTTNNYKIKIGSTDIKFNQFKESFSTELFTLQTNLKSKYEAYRNGSVADQAQNEPEYITNLNSFFTKILDTNTYGYLCEQDGVNLDAYKTSFNRNNLIKYFESLNKKATNGQNDQITEILTGNNGKNLNNANYGNDISGFKIITEGNKKTIALSFSDQNGSFKIKIPQNLDENISESLIVSDPA